MKYKEIFKKFLVCLIIFIAALMTVFTIISVTTLDKVDRSLFGYKFFIVLTDSMSATDFKAGDLVIVKDVEAEKLKPGDIISYKSVAFDNYHEVVTHKIWTKWREDDGKFAFTTFGTTTGSVDEGVVREEDIVGKYQMTIPKLGNVFAFLKTTPGYLFCIFTPFLILIAIQAVHSMSLFKRYKDEVMREVEEEKRQLEDERLLTTSIKEELEKTKKKNRKLAKELASLKEKLQVDEKSVEREKKAPKPRTKKTTKAKDTTKKKNSKKKE